MKPVPRAKALITLTLLAAGICQTTQATAAAATSLNVVASQ